MVNYHCCFCYNKLSSAALMWWRYFTASWILVHREKLMHTHQEKHRGLFVLHRKRTYRTCPPSMVLPVELCYTVCAWFECDLSQSCIEMELCIDLFVLCMWYCWTGWPLYVPAAVIFFLPYSSISFCSNKGMYVVAVLFRGERITKEEIQYNSNLGFNSFQQVRSSCVDTFER